jgi:hypothetical protein
VRDPSRRFGIQVRDSDQLLSLVESGVEEQTAAGRSAVVTRRARAATSQTTNDATAANPAAAPAEVLRERPIAPPPARIGIRGGSVVPD